MNSLFRSYKNYGLLIGAALLLSLATYQFPSIAAMFSSAPEGLYLILALLFALGYWLDMISPKTSIPSFVWAILFGMSLQPVFLPLTTEPKILAILVQLLAALVLFGAGIEVPFKNFKRYFAPIASLSLVGTILTVFLFSVSLEALATLFLIPLPAISILIIGAILASVDPTAIIPSLKSLTFKKPFLRDIAVSESALNDAAGSVLTRLFLVALLTVTASTTVFGLFGTLLKRDTLDALALEILWGILVGVFGAWILTQWKRGAGEQSEHASDPALFFSVPIFAFALGSVVGGSGFLAAFVSGLLFHASTPTKSVQHFFDTFVDKFVKPVIFILLGATVPISALLEVALFGILAALVFMFVIRPAVVFITLLPWSYKKNDTFTIKELLFLSFIRETGAIPAVLLLVALASGVPAPEYVFAIGMWVILLTLILEPPLTPYVARKLGVAK